MKYLAALSALALAACSGGGDGGNITAPANSVAAAPAPAGQDWTQTVSKSAEGGYVMGNPNAPLKLVEYGARLCPACGAFARDSFEPLTTRYIASGKVSFEFRDFLLHGPAELALASLGQCGGPQPFFPLLEQMFSDQAEFVRKWQAMTPAQQSVAGKNPGQIALTFAEALGAIDYVKQRGISDAAARACLTDQASLEALAKATQQAGSDGTVAGTPTFLLNGQKLEGAVSWSDVEKALKGAGA